MFDANEEFKKLNERVKHEEEKYLNAEVTVENYKFPHIYLTEEEIEEFNRESDKHGLDIKVVPLSTYMNLNSPDKSYNVDDEDEIDIEEKERNIEKFMDFLGKNYYKKEEKNENKYIGKKRNKILEDDSEQEESNISSFKSKSYMRSRKIIKNKENKEEDDKSEKSNLSEYNKRDIDIEEEKEIEKSNDKKYIEDKGNKKKKKLIKKKKNNRKTAEISEKFDNYFRKIKETRQKQIDDERRKIPLIKEIIEKSQNLTQEVLREVAKVNHVSLIDDSTLSQNDLNKKDTNQLDRILVDININSNVLKLNSGGKENIKKMKDRIEREKKAREDQILNKRLKEQKKLEIENKNKEKDKISENKKESDISDNNSESDDDSI
jgi:hypothetical protein